MVVHGFFMYSSLLGTILNVDCGIDTQKYSSVSVFQREFGSRVVFVEVVLEISE